MSVHFQAIGWNPAKRRYDLALASFVGAYVLVFAGAGAWLHPYATIETLLIRALGTLALLLLHVILAIGPLCRLNPSFLPLLYNRRHLGVTMFLVALAHGVFTTIQFHAFGSGSALASLFDTAARGEFELYGMLALLILFLMASTSHDFWLVTLSPLVWKTLHMSVYAAYALLIAHVSLGILTQERHPLPIALLALGLTTLIALHLFAAERERRRDRTVAACRVDEIPEKGACVVSVGAERIAIFKYDGCISAVSNVCRHQMGPLGEGRIIDGCITCPWHGYQYLPDSGNSPPPFPEKIETYQVKVRDGWVLVNPQPNAPGTYVEPAQL